jgi:hypothetical protein
MTCVEDVHRELRLEDYLQDLKKIAGLWAQLEKLQREAKRNVKKLPAYRSFLARSIAKIEQDREDAVTPEECDLLCQEYLQYWEGRVGRLGDTLWRRQPNTVEAWCERWLPNVYRKYSNAVENSLTAPVTRRKMRELMQATEEMFDEYERQFASESVRGQSV